MGIICPTFMTVALEKTCSLERSDRDPSRPFFRQRVSPILIQNLEATTHTPDPPH